MTEKLVSRWVVIALVLLAASAALYLSWDEEQNSPLNLGIDLQGGWSITYQIPPNSLKALSAAGESQSEAIAQTVKIISTRIDTLGLKELTVRSSGGGAIIVEAPRLSEAEAADIKKRIVQLGALKFLIGLGSNLGGSSTEQVKLAVGPNGSRASYSFNEAEANQAREDAIAAGKGNPDGYRDGRPFVLHDDSGAALPIVWHPFSPGLIVERLGKTRNASRNEINIAFDRAKKGEEYDKSLILGGWLYSDPAFFGAGLPGFTGVDIEKPRRANDRHGFPAVGYSVKRTRQADFEDYTNEYVNRPMALVLNEEIWSYPTIREALSDDVQISGGSTGFSKDEQDTLVTCLQSGSLKLKPQLASEYQIAPSLGDDSVRRGAFASILGLLLVAVFMIVYYRFGGVLATIALIINLFLIGAMLALFQATLSLPGIAGIILTIGMSVDANILVFERIREELAKGKTLVASAQAGYDRAFITILDANITTLLTAAILYWEGVGPIKGFAITLAMGIVSSIFTAVFVTRTLMGTAIANGWIKELKMARVIPADLRYPFTAKRTIAVPLSVLAVILGIVVFVATPTEQKYGLDFTGGASVQMNFEKPMGTNELRDRLSKMVDASGARLFPQVEPVGHVDTAEGNGFKTFTVKLQTNPQISPEAVRAYSSPLLERAVKSISAASPLTATLGSVSLDVENEEWVIEFETSTTTSVEALEASLGKASDEFGNVPFSSSAPQALNGIDGADGHTEATRWQVRLADSVLQASSVVPSLKASFAADLLATGGFGKVSFMGPSVVAGLKVMAITAVILSLIAIIGYIWFRFKEVKYGLAAAIAVFHDVLVALGVVVFCNMTGLVNVPLTLSIIAAFLTIIGYSLNDTIVLFDRVRENLGNIQGNFENVVNVSINQTLARTVLTSFTTFIVVAILFFVNIGAESAIEGIAFTLMIGVVVGTYSSIFIASPIVLWITAREEAKAAKAKARA